MSSAAETGRPRGRPRTQDDTDRRGQLLAEARRQFAARGFAAASVRSIAREVGVDPSLIHHYFGDKQQLLVASLDLPVDPPARIRTVLQGGLADLGQRIILTFLDTWDPHREAFATLIRTNSSDAHGGPARGLVDDVLVSGLAERLAGPDARLRAAQIGSMVLGLGMMRYVLQVEPLASASAQDVAQSHGAAVQWLVDGH